MNIQQRKIDLIEKIKKEKFNLINNTDKDLLNNILLKKKERLDTLNKIKDKQLLFVREIDVINELNNKNDINLLYNKLTIIDNDIITLNTELKHVEKQTTNKLKDLYSELEEVTKKSQENKTIGSVEKIKYEKVWIDENLGIFINYPKDDVIKKAMTCMFSSVLKDIPKPMFDGIFNDIVNVDQPGLPTLLSTFIDFLMKSVGQGFLKHFLVLKNTIDKLAGLEIGELLSDYIPAIPKTIKDLTALFTDTQQWLMQNMLGPLFDINMPIPELEFDLGAFIPMLPVNIKIPKIDKFDLLNSKTPLNMNMCALGVTDNWLSDNITKHTQENKNDNDSDVYKSLVKQSMILDVDVMDLKVISKTHNINIFDNEVTSQLQNMGITLNNKKHIDKILRVKNNYNFKINDKNFLKYVYELGFSFNDPKHLQKLKIIKQNYKIDISNVEVCILLIESGFNFNNDILFTKDYYDVLGINIGDIELFKKLILIGFNFNNPNMMGRLKIIRNYVDIKDNKSFDNLLEKNINLNNPYFEKILKKYTTISLNWNDDNFLKTEKDILNNVKVDDIKKILNILKYYRKGNNINMFAYGIEGNGDKMISIEKLEKTLGGLKKSKHQTNIFNNDTTLQNIDDIYYDDGKMYFEGSTNETIYDDVTSTYTTTVTTTKNYINWINIFDLKININKYSKYGIKLNDPKNVYVDNKVQRNLLYPNNIQIYNKIVDGKPEFVKKLELLLDFVTNKGWVIDGIRVADKIGTLDYQKMLDVSGKYDLNVVTNINTKDNEISSEVLSKTYGNIDKLGLNVRDSLFSEKIKNLTSYLNINIDEAVMLDTKKIIRLEYKDYKNKGDFKNINLKEHKIDKKYFEDKKYESKITIEHIFDPNKKTQPTKNIIQFDILNKIGFNFQQAKYHKILNKLNGLMFDITRNETKYIVSSLISLGWHIDNGSLLSEKKLESLIGFGFNFDINDDVSNKLDTLNMIGFNFNNVNWKNVINALKSIGLLIKNDDFVIGLKSLYGIGIHFNDDSYVDKITKLKELSLDFSLNINDKKDWITKMNFLDVMGLDFNDDEWLSKHEKILKLKKIGIDFNDSEIRKTINLLKSIGLNFADNDYMEKLKYLSKLKIVNISNVGENLIKENQKNTTDILNKINYLKKIKNGDLKKEYANKIIKLNKLKNSYVDIIFNIKNKLVNVLNINDLNKIDGLNLMMLNINDDPTIISNNIKQIIVNKQLYDIDTNNNIKVINKKIENINKINLNINELNILLSKIYYDEKNNNINIQQELAILEEEKNNITNYKNVEKITFSSFEKFEALEKLNINFAETKMMKTAVDMENNVCYCNDWKSNINILSEKMNFSDKDWKLLAIKNKDLIPIIPAIEWMKTIKKIIITIITTPIKMLMDIVKKFLEILKELLGIPLNPTKIPDWAIGIIDKFNGFVELIMKLPTLDGLIDFLFVDINGLKLIDSFVPNFAQFISDIKEKANKMTEKIKVHKTNITIMNKKLKEIVIEKKKQYEFLKQITNIKSTSTINGLLSKLDTLKQNIKLKSPTNKLLVKIDELKEKINREISTQTQNNLAKFEELKENIILVLTTHIQNSLTKINNNVDKFKTLIKKKQKDIIELTKKSNTFKNISELKNNIELLKDEYGKIKQYEKIMEFLPVCLNMVSCIPKIIANIFVGLLNSVGNMENLPDLWKFDMVT